MQVLFQQIKQKGCYTCGGGNHLQKDCWYSQPAEQQQQGSSSSNNSRGRGQRGTYYRGNNHRGSSHRGNGHRGRGRSKGRAAAHHNNWNSSKSTGGTPNSFAAQVCNNLKVKSNSNNNNNDDSLEWLLDSGCKAHVTNNDKYFGNFINLKEPVKIKLADGKTILATKLENIKVIFNNYYNESKFTIKNVYYAKDMKMNLLSFSKITQKLSMVAKHDTAKIYNENRE